MKTQTLSAFSKWVLNLSAVQRLFICLVLAVVSTTASSYSHIQIWTSLMIGWDVFSFFMICFSMIIFFRASSRLTIKLAQKEDESRTVIFMIVLISVLISLFGILIMLRKSDQVTQGLHEVASMAGVGLSWIMLHMIFALHYAHVYYASNAGGESEAKAGLEFPGNEVPDYLDFAYFSFVIGMTFQVSDVSIMARNIRRLVLLHSLISFLFNTVIVALMISMISGLGHAGI